MDAADKIDLVETVGQHGWHTPLREATVAWMLRWLVGQEREIHEPDNLEVLTEAEIQVTPTGQVLDIEGARSVYAINRDRMERLRQQREAAWEEERDAMWDEVRRITGIRRMNELSVTAPRRVGQIQHDGYRVDQLVIEPEPGIVLPSLAFIPDGGADQVVLWLDEKGKSDDAVISGIRQRVADGQAVLAVDLRGLGETRSEQNRWYGSRNGHDGANVVVAYMLGRSYVAMRAEDVLVAARVARDLVDGDTVVQLVAHGAQVAVPALHAVALERDFFGAVEISGAPRSFEQIVENPLASDQLVHTVQGALKVYDLTDLQTAIAGEEIAFEYEFEEVWDYVRNVECEPRIPAHTMDMKAAHTSLLIKMPWVQPTPSADENAVLGYTAGWAEGDVFRYDGKVFDPAKKSFAPEIPPQAIFGYLITDPETVWPSTISYSRPSRRLKRLRQPHRISHGRLMDTPKPCREGLTAKRSTWSSALSPEEISWLAQNSIHHFASDK